jgi:hypothetical protein
VELPSDIYPLIRETKCLFMFVMCYWRACLISSWVNASRALCSFCANVFSFAVIASPVRIMLYVLSV